MMLVLDTDHLVEYQKGFSAQAVRLKERLDKAEQPFVTTVLTVEEMMRGWMAAIRRIQDPHHQISAYLRFRKLFAFFAAWEVLDWNELAADEFIRQRKLNRQIGTMDLKIASLVLANNAILLSRNVRDFARVPGLRVEDWLS